VSEQTALATLDPDAQAILLRLEVLAKPGTSVDSGRDSHRDPPQLVLSQLLLEADAVTAACRGWSLSSPTRTPLAGTQLGTMTRIVRPKCKQPCKQRGQISVDGGEP